MIEIDDEYYDSDDFEEFSGFSKNGSETFKTIKRKFLYIKTKEIVERPDIIEYLDDNDIKFYNIIRRSDYNWEVVLDD